MTEKCSTMIDAIAAKEREEIDEMIRKAKAEKLQNWVAHNLDLYCELTVVVDPN